MLPQLVLLIFKAKIIKTSTHLDVIDKICPVLALFSKEKKFMWSCYLRSAFLLVILTASAIRNLKDVNSSVNPETDPI